jgi:predicted RNA-binding protein with PUA-like domain
MPFDTVPEWREPDRFCYNRFRRDCMKSDMAESMNYWLVKSEPDQYSIDDLERAGSTSWEGVRNYQARNILRDQMKVGDRVLFYASNADPSGVVGIAEVAREGYPDHFAFDPDHVYFDPKSSPENPIWYMVDLRFVEKFSEMVSLAALKEAPGLERMMVVRRGSRLSVQPVTREEFEAVARLRPPQNGPPPPPEPP